MCVFEGLSNLHGILSGKPYKKPNTEITYVSNLSNHPKYIRNHIPTMIKKRLTTLSSDETAFNLVKDEYNQALLKSNYTPDMSYDTNPLSQKKGRKRKRKVIYFQPPYSATVKTPIGKMFLNLIKKHFNPQHPFYKILNPRSIKLSYSCLPNVKAKITGCNKKILKVRDEDDKKLCNCQKSRTCPVNGKCLLEKVVYKAEVTDAVGETKVYVGSTGKSFKERYNTHKATLKHKDHPSGTALSRHFWKTKLADKKDPKITWSILNRASTATSERFGCTVCNMEKIAIARTDKDRSLNRRNELVSSCPHFLKTFFKKPGK